jgi:hypothetical protein
MAMACFFLCVCVCVCVCVLFSEQQAGEDEKLNAVCRLGVFCSRGKKQPRDQT